MNFLDYLQSIITVSETLKAELQRITKKKKVEKGEYLIRDGMRCSDIYFIEKGFLRGFYLLEDKEVTNWLALDGEFGTSFYSFITHAPSQESIEAVETSDLIQIPYADLQRLYADFPETERIGRLLTENYYIRLEGRLLAFQFTTAKERYDKLMVSNPLLLQRAPLGYIASYLGITQETLSRIRTKH